MAQNWDLDPEKGDYLMQGGSPKQTDSLKVPAYFRLKVKRNRWMYAPDRDYGSDYYTVAKRPSSNANTRLENIGAVALQPLVDDGRASSVELNVVQNTRNNVGLQVKVVDASGEEESMLFRGLGL